MKQLIKIYAIGCCLTIALSTTQAQDAATLKKIESARIGLITERLGLTPDQAQEFWPLYQEFSQQRREIRKGFRQAKRNHDPSTATEEENQQLLNMGLEVKERELDLEKAYSERLLNVISTRQLVQLRRAEDDFRDMILRKVQERQQRQRMQRRNDERIRRQRN